MGYEKTTLPNGVRIVTNTMPHTRSVTTIINYGVGSRYEEAHLSGISHFIEHMIFKGTTKRPTAAEISEAIEGVGGITNASTGRETTSYWAKVADKDFNLAFDVLTDMLLNSNFDPDEIEKERKVIIEELNSTLDSPPDLVNEIINEVVWGNTPVGRDIGGTEATVSTIGRDDLLRYMKHLYLPGSIVVSVAGNIEHARVVEMVAATLGALESGTHPEATAAHPLEDGASVRLVSKETEQTNLCLAVPALPYDHPQRYVLALLDTILGGGMSSRLFQEIREKRGLAYTVESYASQLSDTGAMIIYAGVDPERADETIEAIIGELRRIATEPIPATELRKAKEYNKGRMLLGLEDTRSVASWAASQELLLNRIYTPEEVVVQLEAVTGDDITALATELFAPGKMRLAIIGPHDDPARFERLLTA